MTKEVKLTPKDCLYLDDALSQMCAISTSIANECEMVEDKEIAAIMEETIQVLSTHFDACKTLLKEASGS